MWREAELQKTYAEVARCLKESEAAEEPKTCTPDDTAPLPSDEEAGNEDG